MGLFGLLLLCYGVFGIVCGSRCVPETFKCSQYWLKTEPHKNLVLFDAELDHWCSEQPRFYGCLEDVLLPGKNKNLSHLPTDLLISKLYAEDLCSEDSRSRERYLENSDCINQQNTDFCTEREYLDIVSPYDDIPPTRQSLSEKTYSCITAIIVKNCGFDAGRVFRHLLKITTYGDEVCGIESSLRVPVCEERGSKDTERDQKISVIYNGLVNRIGSIPEQNVVHVYNVLSNELDGSESTSDEETFAEVKIHKVFPDENSVFQEAIVQPLESVDRMGSMVKQNIAPFRPKVSNEVDESESISDDEAIAELIKNALDFIDRSGDEPEDPAVSNKLDESEGIGREDSISSIIDEYAGIADKVAAEKMLRIAYGLIDRSGDEPEDPVVPNELDESGGISDDEAIAELIKNALYFIDRSGDEPEDPVVSNKLDESEGIGREDSVSSILDEYEGIGDKIAAEKILKIAYGLVDRIGAIPEQGIEPIDPVSNELDESEGTSDEAVTEAIKIALDSLDENILSQDDFDESLDSHPEPLVEVPSRSEDSPVSEDYKLYKKYPIITQVYRDIIFYNYSSLEYAFYWRQPEFVIVENISCEHLQPSFMRGIIFRCIVESRSRDPDCVSNATVHEPVTPELIRDVDAEVPHDSIVEFGPRPDWMKDMDDAYEEKRLRDQRKSTELPEEFSSTENPVFTTTSTLLHCADAITKPPEPQWWEATHKTLLPDDIRSELMELFLPEPEKFVPAPMQMFQVGNSLFIFIYDPFTNAIENMTCSRFNECHPRGKGLFKCSMMRRKIDTCDVCYGGTGANIEGLPVSWPSRSEAVFKISDSTGPTETPEGSGLNEVTPAEQVTFVFSGDVESGPEASNENELVYHVIDESNYINDQPLDAREMEERLQSSDGDDSSVRLVVLDQSSVLDANEDSTYVPELVYEIDDMSILDSKYVSKSSNYGLLNENIIVLQSIPSVGDGEAEYAIVNSSDELQS